MIDFIKDRKAKGERKKNVSELMGIAKGERDKILGQKIRDIVLEELKGIQLDQRFVEIGQKVTEVDRKVDEVKKSFAPFSRVKEDGVRKIKLKRMIAELLMKHKRLTANDLSIMLNLSRTRCSEYLTELEKDGVASGMVVNRQKFYEFGGLKDKYKPV
jgi:response regulator of citrate/malate metabolism